VGARDDLHQRGFARAVFAQQGMHLARPKLEGNPSERAHGAESLGDPRELEEGNAH